MWHKTLTNCILNCSPSNLHNYSLLLDQSYFDILFHIQIAARTVTPVPTSFLCGLWQSGPFRPFKCLLPVYKTSTQFIICAHYSLWYHSQHPFVLQYPNSSSPRVSSVSLQPFLLNILSTIFAVFATKLNVRWSLHFVAFVFFYRIITVTLGHYLFHVCWSSVLSLFWDRLLRFPL
jgi:hypothetical protein